MNLFENIQNLFSGNKGIVASDSSPASQGKKFEKLGIPATEANYLKWREILVNADLPHVGGMINHTSILDGVLDSGQTFLELLSEHKIEPIVKIDEGLAKYPADENLHITKGLDRILNGEMEKWAAKGVKFAKWRCLFPVVTNPNLIGSIVANANIMALYARICQNNGIVPIVEPEVQHLGSHSLEQHMDTSQNIHMIFFDALLRQGVDLTGIIYKTSMTLAGSEASISSTPEEVGKNTAEILTKFVPENAGAIVFLSGGQSADQACQNMKEIVNNWKRDQIISTSFERAHESDGLEVWKGLPENIESAKHALRKRAEIIASCRIPNT